MQDTIHQLDVSAKQLAKNYLFTEGQLLEILVAMEKENAFIKLNYQGVYSYCIDALKLSEAQSYYFKTVEKASIRVPALKEAVTSGEISLSKARRIAPVISNDNHEEWITKAKTLSQKDLEKEVTVVNPSAKPVKDKITPVSRENSYLKVTIDGETDEDIQMLQNLLAQRLGRPVTLAETIKWALNMAREKVDPEIKAKKSLERQQKLISPISSGNKTTDSSSSKKSPGRKAFPNLVKHQVINRQGYQCSFVSPDGRRCQQKKWLDFHVRQESWRFLGGQRASPLKPNQQEELRLAQVMVT